MTDDEILLNKDKFKALGLMWLSNAYSKQLIYDQF